MTIGDKLRRIREDRKLSLIQLEKITNVSKSHLSRIENNQTVMSIDVLRNICNSLEISYDYFLDSEIRSKETKVTLGNCIDDLFLKKNIEFKNMNKEELNILALAIVDLSITILNLQYKKTAK